MATNDEAGAVALAQYFIADLYPYTFASGDKTEWLQLSDDGCNFCNSIIEILDEMALAGETSVADPTVIESVESVTLVEGSRYAVTLQVLQGESRRISRSGEEVGISDAGRYMVNYAIQWSEGWSVLAVDATPLDADGT